MAGATGIAVTSGAGTTGVTFGRFWGGVGTIGMGVTMTVTGTGNRIVVAVAGVRWVGFGMGMGTGTIRHFIKYLIC